MRKQGWSGRRGVGCSAGVVLLLAMQACGGKSVGEGEQAAGGSRAVGSAGRSMVPVPIPQPGSTGGTGQVPSIPPSVGGMTTGAGGAAHAGHAGQSVGGAVVVADAGAPATGGADDDCNAGGASPVCDFGLTCAFNAECLENDCYFPGTLVNPICAKHCFTSADCPSGSACTGPFGDTPHCFVLCTDAAECLAINAFPQNPLDCVDMADPRAPQGQTVCAQSSEP